MCCYLRGWVHGTPEATDLDNRAFENNPWLMDLWVHLSRSELGRQASPLPTSHLTIQGGRWMSAASLGKVHSKTSLPCLQSPPNCPHKQGPGKRGDYDANPVPILIS